MEIMKRVDSPHAMEGFEVSPGARKSSNRAKA
jgi:hypothetical protein